MEPESREQTNHPPRCSLCRFGEGVEFRYWGIRRHIEASTGPDDETLLFGEPKILAGDSVDAEVSRSKDPGRPSELRDSGYGFGDRHYLILHNVGGCLQVPTLIASARGPRHVNILPKWNYFDKKSSTR